MALFEESCELVRRADVFPDIPVVVLSGAKPSWQVPQTHMDEGLILHGKLAALTSSGRHVITIKSGHLLMWTEPEIVIDAIRSVISKS